MQKHRLIVSGATGLVGTALIQNQREKGSLIVRLVRGGAASRTPELQDVPWKPEQPQAPLSSPSALSLLEDCDAAVHLAGANLSGHRWSPSYKRTILNSRVDSSKALIRIFSQLKKPPRVLVCASATGIYGERGDEVLTEDSAHGHGFLPEVCEAWEASTNAAGALGIRVVHLRFGVVLAPAGGALKKLLPVFKAALGGRLGDGRQWMSWVTLADVVRAIEFAVVDDQAAGAFNTVAPNPVTNAEFTHRLAAAVRRPAPWIVPAFALRLAFGQMARDTILASTRVLPARLEAMGFCFRDGVLERALHGMLGS